MSDLRQSSLRQGQVSRGNRGCGIGDGDEHVVAAQPAETVVGDQVFLVLAGDVELALSGRSNVGRAVVEVPGVRERVTVDVGRSRGVEDDIGSRHLEVISWRSG